MMHPETQPVIISPYLRLPLRPLGEVRRLQVATRTRPVADADPATADAFGVSDARDRPCTTRS